MESTITISYDSLFASCLLGAGTYRKTTLAELKDIEREKMAFRCGLIMPKSIKNDTDKMKTLWCQIMSNLVDDLESEAEAMRVLKDAGEVKHLELDYSKIDIADKEFAKFLAGMAILCGVGSLSDGFDELDRIEAVCYAN